MKVFEAQQKAEADAKAKAIGKVPPDFLDGNRLGPQLHLIVSWLPHSQSALAYLGGNSICAAGRV